MSSPPLLPCFPSPTIQSVPVSGSTSKGYPNPVYPPTPPPRGQLQLLQPFTNRNQWDSHKPRSDHVTLTLSTDLSWEKTQLLTLDLQSRCTVWPCPSQPDPHPPKVAIHVLCHTSLLNVLHYTYHLLIF